MFNKKPNSGATGGGYTLTGLTHSKSKISSMRREHPKPKQASKGVKRPAK